MSWLTDLIINASDLEPKSSYSINQHALRAAEMIHDGGGGGGGSGTVTSVNGDSGPDVVLDKSDIGLANVDNTSDASKPVSSATTTQLNLKAPLASPAFTGTPTGITKTHVGLGSVDNTADADKPLSNNSIAALALKAPLASPAFTGTPTGITKTHVGLANVDNTTDVNKPISTLTQAALDTKAPLNSPAFTGTPTGITKTHVGLGNVDNTTDLNKPVSTAVTTALASKADLVGGVVPTAQIPSMAMTDVFPVISQAAMLALTAQHGDVAVRSDISKTFMLASDSPGTLADWIELKAPAGAVSSVNTQTGAVVLGKADVGLGNVDNTADTDKPVSSATTTALALKAPLASPAFTGTPTGITKAHVGLGSVDNTSDASKPVSSAQQSALDLKANTASPAFTGTPTGLTKAHVGLGNVDNTTDAGKPVSTATQTALDLKAPLASPAFTGTPTGITKTHVGLGNVDNTSDANKPISTATQTALDNKSTVGHTHAVGDLPAGSVICAIKDTSGNWPGGTTNTAVRPTTRTDITVIWMGIEPSPPIVSSGTAGMLDKKDFRVVPI